MQPPVGSVDARIQTIAERLADTNEKFRDERVPGLQKLLEDYLAPDVDVDDVIFHRGLLKMFKSSQDQTYEHTLAQHTTEERKKIEEFVAGGSLKDVSKDFHMGPSLGCRQELEKMHNSKSIFHISAAGPIRVKGLSSDAVKQSEDDWFLEAIEKLGELFDKDGHGKDSILVYKDAEFQNWGLNINNTPQFTCVPTTVKDIQRIVKYGAEHQMSVRCSGYRHSWSPIFGRSGQILISLLKLATATKLPNIASLPFPESDPTELESIDIVPGTPHTAGNTLVRVGCATTNERLRRWCVKNNKVTIPLNVIMVEITLGGSNAPICHGAGRRNQTLSDLVRRIEYVDAHGKLQVVEKPEHLRAASGCFGLMGVVTHITMEFPPMTYAMLAPLKCPVIQAVPPPPEMTDEQIPPALLKGVDRSPKQKEKDQADFEKRARDDYYAEWFWFPFSDYAWVNTWNNVSDSHGVVEFPDTLHIFLSFIETVTMNILQNTPLLDELIQAVHMSEAAVTLISRAAMFALPEKQIKTYLPDALHFQRAIQNVRVRDTEVEMPLVAKVGHPDKIDFSIVQRAWWDAILKVYEPKHRENCPMRMPLEMRIMGSSDVIMAPQRYNSLGTCSIEVLTLHSASDIWHGFAQEVVDMWMAYEDPNTGKKLKTRPHWAKEWKTYQVDGKPWAEKMKKETYKEEIAEFKSILTAIGMEHGWTLRDLKSRFSNEFFDEFYFDDVDGVHMVSSTGTEGKVASQKGAMTSVKEVVLI